MEINNLTKSKVDKEKFSTVAKIVLKGENKRMDVSLAFVTKAEIRKLNRKFRGKDKATDVLAFDGINEVVICQEFVNEKKENIMRVFVHGVLHLCGYDHEKTKKEAIKMQEREEYYLKITKLKISEN